jgi:hypothetical protein
MIDAAVDQYAIEANKVAGDSVSWAAIQAYLKKGSNLYNSGKSVIGGRLQRRHLHCGRRHLDPAGTGAALSDVATQAEFWSPYTLVQ